MMTLLDDLLAIMRRTGALVIFAVHACGVAGADPPASPPDADEFRTILNAVITANQENQQQLKSLVAVWTRKSHENGFLKGRHLDTDGEYEMWIDGEKVATNSSENNGATQDGKPTIVEVKMRTAYNGIDFRAMPNVRNAQDIAVLTKPELKPEHDWLSVIGWRHQTDSVLEIASDMPANVQLKEWEIAKEDDQQLLRFRLENKNDHGSIFAVVDVIHGGSLIQEDWFNGEGKIYGSKKITIKEVIEGLWMPVEVVAVSYDPATGEETLHHDRKLDLEKCAFNDPSRIPKEVFNLPIRPDMEVSDYRGVTRMTYRGANAPLPMADLNTRIAAMLAEDAVKGISSRKAMWMILIINGIILIAGVGIWQRNRRRHQKSEAS